MSKIYKKPEPDDKVWQILHDLLDTHHEELKECDAKIAIVLVESDTGHAITHGGYRAYAKVRIATGLERSLQPGRERFDAVIQIDALVWEKLKHEISVALIDHELSHISFTGEQHDDTRPKLKMRKGDWNIGDGFEAVLNRHGVNSLSTSRFATSRSNSMTMGITSSTLPATCQEAQRLRGRPVRASRLGSAVDAAVASIEKGNKRAVASV
ncbi:MAG: hypothetical protein IPK83_18620 [Planctomycetes bacterium]|nr:hypothetical protein [Planctomycetota bacterium]